MFERTRHLLKTVLSKTAWRMAGAAGMQGLWPWPLTDRRVRLVEMDLPIPHLPEHWAGRRIVQLSDLHLSWAMRADRLRDVVARTNRLDPDLVVITGDFVSSCDRLRAIEVAEILSELRPRLCTFAVLGNHDYGVWHPRLRKRARMGFAEDLAYDLLETANVHVLRNEAWLMNGLAFVGVGDYWAGDFRPHVACEPVDRLIPTIGLCHNPDRAWALFLRGVDAVLCGHTHGQRTPWFLRWLFPTEQPHRAAGVYRPGRDQTLYVNVGVGPSLRWNRDMQPEIAVFTLRQTEEARSQKPEARSRRLPFPRRFAQGVATLMGY